MSLAAKVNAGRRLAARAGTAGFTLIELAIVGVCVSLLAVAAITSYEFATVKARRSTAQGCLIEAAQFMERYYTTHMSYEGGSIPNCTADVGPHYAITFSVAPTATAYTLQAEPKGRQAAAEKECGTMSIDHVGRKTPAADCW